MLAQSTSETRLTCPRPSPEPQGPPNHFDVTAENGRVNRGRMASGLDSPSSRAIRGRCDDAVARTRSSE